jgi:nicotinamidase/pyrazinamidase
MGKKFVVVIDAQNDFIAQTGALAVAGADSLIAPLANYIKALRPETTQGVLWTFDTHDPEEYADSEEAKQFGIHCVKPTWGWQLVIDNPTALNTDLPMYRLEKDVFGMWWKQFMVSDFNEDPTDPDLTLANNGIELAETMFDRLKQSGVTDIEIVGVAADFCVHWAVEGFVKRGFNVTIKRDLVKGIVRDIDQVLAEEYAGVPNVKII